MHALAALKNDAEEQRHSTSHRSHSLLRLAGPIRHCAYTSQCQYGDIPSECQLRALTAHSGYDESSSVPFPCARTGASSVATPIRKPTSHDGRHIVILLFQVDIPFSQVLPFPKTVHHFIEDQTMNERRWLQMIVRVTEPAVGSQTARRRGVDD